MGFKSFMKNGVGRGLNPKKWMDYDRLKSDSLMLKNLASSTFSHAKPQGKRQETFEEACQRYQLTEADIQQRIRSSRQLCFIFLAFAGLVLLYTLYQWTAGHFINGVICFFLSLLMLVYAFREHFNAYQMRRRQLGCRYAEWLRDTFKRP